MFKQLSYLKKLQKSGKYVSDKPVFDEMVSDVETQLNSLVPDSVMINAISATLQNEVKAANKK